MEIRFIGSGDAFGSGGRLQACILLSGGSGSLLLDCGATSLVGMKRQGIDPSSIGHVLLSHLHGDHFGGLPFLILDGQFSRRERDLHIAGPPGTQKRLRTACEVLYPGSWEVERRFKIHVDEVQEGATVGFGPAHVTPHAVEHASGAPAFAWRVAFEERIVAYTGDTAWTDSLVDVAADADVLIAEAYFFDKQVKFHLDHAALVANEPRLRAKRVVLTHMSADMLAHRHDARFELAEDGLTITA